MRNSKVPAKDGYGRNSSGYSDPTAKAVIDKEDAETERFKKLLSVLFYVCENAGFHIEERIVIKDLKTGKVWR